MISYPMGLALDNPAHFGYKIHLSVAKNPSERKEEKTMREIERWDPFRQMRDEMDRLFESFWDRTGFVETGAWAPRINIEEERDRYVIHAELPGMTKDDITLSLTERTLSLSGERKWEREHSDATLHRAEIFTGRFQRTVTFPDEIDPAKAKATYREGILTVELPKSERARPTEIEIQVE